MEVPFIKETDASGSPKEVGEAETTNIARSPRVLAGNEAIEGFIFSRPALLGLVCKLMVADTDDTGRWSVVVRARSLSEKSWDPEHKGRVWLIIEPGALLPKEGGRKCEFPYREVEGFS